ncbi:MAG: LysR substrate-binding domain-containing protein [Pseudomonadota bacterium]
MLKSLRALAVFAKAMEHGSFRAAAAELKISPSVVSHHIAQLEQELGVALIYRSTRQLSLTRDGEQLLEAARAVVAAAEAGVAAVKGQGPGLSGELNVTAPAVLAKSFLAGRVAGFVQSHPHVSVSIDYTDERRDVIGEGIDVAIRMGWLRDSALKSRKLLEVERILLASSTYMANRKTPQTPADVEDLDWLELTPVPLKPAFKRRSSAPVTPRLTPRLRVNSATALYQLMVEGAGLAILPRFLATDDLASGRVIQLLPQWQLPSISIYAVRPANSPRRGPVTEFVKALARKDALRA